MAIAVKILIVFINIYQCTIFISADLHVCHINCIPTSIPTGILYITSAFRKGSFN